MQTKVTFLMIAYNAEKTIGRTVRSILNQTEKNINLIVRNNGSTDKTQEILEEIARGDARLRIVHNEKNFIDNNGDFYTKDGVLRIWPIDDRELLGEYISIVDADDLLLEEFVEEMYSAANKIDAEITVCGHHFVNEEYTVVGERVPPEVETIHLSEEGLKAQDEFPQFYNCFRTWWAKLFKTDFFLEKYDAAWECISGTCGVPFDTISMHKYLMNCERLITIPKAMYGMLQSSSSTYKNPVISTYTLLEMERLWQSCYNLQVYLKVLNSKNIGFSYGIEKAYFMEKLIAIERKEEPEKEFAKLLFITESTKSKGLYDLCVANPSIKEDFRQLIMGYADKIIGRNPRYLPLYCSYLSRLHYVEQALENKSESLLLYPILLGCLYDQANTLLLGSDLMEKVPISDEYRNIAKAMKPYQNWEAERGFDINVYVYGRFKVTTKEEEAKLEDALIAAEQAEDYSAMSDTIEQLNKINPLNPKTMFYQTQLLLMIEENELAMILANTMHVLYPTYVEGQMLYWGLLGEMQGGI